MVGWSEFELQNYEARRAPKKHFEPSDATTEESKLHDDIEEELRRLRWYYVHSRMDKKTTTQLGVTDFIIAIPGGKTLWCEAKAKGKKLTIEQNITRHILSAAGHWHEVVFSKSQFLEVISKCQKQQ